MYQTSHGTYLSSQLDDELHHAVEVLARDLEAALHLRQRHRVREEPLRRESPLLDQRHRLGEVSARVGDDGGDQVDVLAEELAELL